MREWAIESYPYVIRYPVVRGMVRKLRVRHTAGRPANT